MMRTSAFSLGTALLLLFGSGGARGAEIRLDTPPACLEQHVDVAAMPDGGFVAVWQGTALPGVVEHPRVFARLFGPGGTPLGLPIQVNGDSDGISPVVAANAAGNFLVVWNDASRGVLMSRLFGPTGTATLRERELASFASAEPAVTATRNGGFAVVSVDSSTVALTRLDATGQPQGSPQVIASYTLPLQDPNLTYADPVIAAYGPSGVVVAWAFEDHLQRTLYAAVVAPAVEPLALDPTPLPFQSGDVVRPRPAVAATGSGRILVAWNDRNIPRAQVFGDDRQPLGPPFQVADGAWLKVSAPDAAASAGDFLVTWHATPLFPAVPGQAGYIQRIGADGVPVGPVFQAWDTSTLVEPAIATGAGGRAVVAWQTGGQPEGPGGSPAVQSCFSDGLYARTLDLSPGVLRLQNGRFEARIHWTDHAGNSGEGQAVPLTDDSGYFWFFGPDNLEVMLKVLDGRAVNGSFWIFYGALSDVAYTLTVTDTATGRTKTYENPAGRLASRADTAAFPAAGGEASRLEAPAASAVSRIFEPAANGAGPCADPAFNPVLRPGLCFGDRFEVEVSWQAAGKTGAGQGVRLTDDSGYLWFFGPNNAELVVKVLDGRAVNDHFWVFYGALSDVDYTIVVRDIATGTERTYHNPAGRLASVADTEAF